MSLDRGRGAELMSVGVLTGAADTGRHRSTWRVEKFGPDERRDTCRRLCMPVTWEPVGGSFHIAGVTPAEVWEESGTNLITDNGWNLLMKNVAGTAGTLFSATVGRIGTSAGGASATTVTAAYTDTNLAYTTTDYWQLLSAAPTVGSTHSAGLAFAATFATGNANWQWMEAAIDQGTSSASNVSATSVMFNHIGWNTGSYTGPGTKTSAQTWNVTVTITWT